ncbi:MAG: carbon-nitrogen hydrolase family protein [Micromonosporaceae bacterium]
MNLPDRAIRVAVVQAEAVPGQVATNAVTAAGLVRHAAAEGARLAVLPELFLPAYHPPVLGADPAGCDVAAADDGTVADPRLDPLREAGRDCGVSALIGASVRRPDGVRHCSALLVDPAGEARAAYHKQHLCGPDERRLFSPGGYGATLELDDWRFGIGICYDGCFPEHARAAAVAGAHAYLCPTGYVIGGEHRRDLYYAARALDNSCYVGFANPVGGDGQWRFNGGSSVYDPQGRPIQRADDAGEAVVVAELDPALLAKTRADHGMLAEAAVQAPAEPGPRRTVRVPATGR